jgi:seryl-tRNA(Sec) selenium transferase
LREWPEGPPTLPKLFSRKRIAVHAGRDGILLGADLIVHWAAKFIGGRGDLIAGILAGPKEIV